MGLGCTIQLTVFYALLSCDHEADFLECLAIAYFYFFLFSLSNSSRDVKVFVFEMLRFFKPFAVMQKRTNSHI